MLWKIKKQIKKDKRLAREKRADKKLSAAIAECPVWTEAGGTEYLFYRFVTPQDVAKGTGDDSLGREFAKMKYHSAWAWTFTGYAAALTVVSAVTAYLTNGLVQDASMVSSIGLFLLTYNFNQRRMFIDQDQMLFLDCLEGENDNHADPTTFNIYKVTRATADRLLEKGKKCIVVKERGLAEKCLIDLRTLHIMPKSYYPTYKKTWNSQQQHSSPA